MSVKSVEGHNMKATYVLAALGSLCCMLSGASTEESPEIIGPDNIKLRASLGKRLILGCRAYTNCEDDVTLIYWLVNGAFPEMAVKDGRVFETNELMSANGTILQRDLVLKKVTSADFRSAFICVVINPVGIVKKNVTLKAMRRSFVRKHKCLNVGTAGL